MSRTAVQLIQELANRMGELALFSATSVGTTTTIISTGIKKFIPASTSNLAGWVWALGPTNIGTEARASSYSPSLETLTLISPGFASSVASGDAFEWHARTRRSRKLEALNDAIGELGLACHRTIVDTSLMTTPNTWEYPLPSEQTWLSITSVNLQLQTSGTLIGYPYADMVPWDWVIREATDLTGERTLTLQFGSLPPSGRIIRIEGAGYYPELADDADVLPLSGPWERRALGWIMDWAKYRLLDETVERQPGGESERYRQRAIDKLTVAKEDILTRLRPRPNGRITVPGRGQGRISSNPASNVRYFGGLNIPPG